MNTDVGKLTIRDLDTGQTHALLTSPGPEGQYVSSWYGGGRIDLSGDGRYLLFTSTAPINGYVGWAEQVWRYDAVTDSYDLVSYNEEGEPGRGRSNAYSISADGTTATFRTVAPDIGSGHEGWRFIVRNLQTGVSRELGGTFVGDTQISYLSDNSRYSSSYGETWDDAKPYVTVHDHLTGESVERSLPVGSLPSSCGSLMIQTLPDITGTRVLVARTCTGHALDSTLFLFELDTGKATFIRKSEDDSWWGYFAASPDLRHLTFSTDDPAAAQQGGLPDSNGFLDVYQWDAGPR